MMTGLAQYGGVDMTGRFACRRHAIMTACARTQHFIVIDGDNGCPANEGRVAGITLIGGINVHGRFANGGDTVMAALTGTEDFVVIDADHRAECCGVMTGITQITGQDVSGVFAQGGDIVMATDTSLTHHGAVIKTTARYYP